MKLENSVVNDKEISEIFDILQEECAEVIQAISKIRRFGLDEVYNGTTNREHLEEEIGDLQCMIALLCSKNIVREENMIKASKQKLQKLNKWSSIKV